MNNLGSARIFACDEEMTGKNLVPGRDIGNEDAKKNLSPNVNPMSKRVFSCTDREAANYVIDIDEIEERRQSGINSNMKQSISKNVYKERNQGNEVYHAAFNEKASQSIYGDKNIKKLIKKHIIKHSEDYAPIFSFSELFRDDDSLVKYKRTNIAFDVYGAVPVLIFQIVVFGTRASLYKSYYLNTYFSCAFTISLLSVGSFAILLLIIALERHSDPRLNQRPEDVINTNLQSESHSFASNGNDFDPDVEQCQGMSNKKQGASSRQYVANPSVQKKNKNMAPNVRQSSTDSSRVLLPVLETSPFNSALKSIIKHWIFQEAFDAVEISGTFTIGLYLLARVVQGQCRQGVGLFESQECNPVANSGSIPQDQVLLCYITPVIWQLLLKRTRFRTILISWAISTAFVCTSIVISNSYMEVYSVLYSLYFLYIHYETERFLKVSYVQNMMFLEEVFKQQKREKRHALEKVNYEFEVEAMKEKNRFFLEINHLKILMDNIAHNLRTPIQSINMGIELLRSEYGSIIDEHRIINKKGSKSELPFDFLIKTISASCVFMSMAINRSVDFSKINSNVGLVPTFETKDFLEVISEPIDCIRTLQNSVSIKVGTVPTDMCNCIILDEIWVKESLLCLLSNAVKYSNGGVICVDTEIVSERNPIPKKQGSKDLDMSEEPDSRHTSSSARSRTSHEPAYIRITVVDSGVGISPEKRENIFQPLRPSKKLSGGTESGTGLGLYSLFKRMEALKGSCGMCPRSDGQEGSVFWFTFPYRPDFVAEDFNATNYPNGRKPPAAIAFNSFDTSINYSSDEVNSSMTKGLTVIGGNNWAQRRLRTKKMPSTPLPLMKGEVRPSSLAAASPKSEIVPALDLSLSPKVEPLRILIIEDSITIILIVTKLLEKKGHIVESEKNGFSGLNRLKEVFNTKMDFDLVLLDVQMPVLDGFECVSRYRAFEVEQIKNLNNSALNKNKTDTLKLLLHSKYFRINYANNLRNNSFNIDNFKYQPNSISQTECASSSNLNSSNYDESSPHNFSNLPRRMESIEVDADEDSKDEAGSMASNSQSNKSDVVLRRGNMAIVGMSANNDNESRILALRKGMNFFITKPFSNVDLQNILNLFDA